MRYRAAQGMWRHPQRPALPSLRLAFAPRRPPAHPIHPSIHRHGSVRRLKCRHFTERFFGGDRARASNEIVWLSTSHDITRYDIDSHGDQDDTRHRPHRRRCLPENGEERSSPAVPPPPLRDARDGIGTTRAALRYF